MCPSWQYARHTTAIYAANPTLPANSPPRPSSPSAPSGTEIGNKSSFVLPSYSALAAWARFTFCWSFHLAHVPVPANMANGAAAGQQNMWPIIAKTDVFTCISVWVCIWNRFSGSGSAACFGLLFKPVG